MGLSYKDSGVDVEGGNAFVRKIAPLVKSTFSNRVITGIGGFGALFSGSFEEMKEPVLVSGTDGVGTKLQIAKMMKKHDTVGIDAVAMCVNDIVVSGARPLFFLDYISCGKLDEPVHVDVVKGIVEGCRQAGCSLIGGETAEHPDVIEPDDYDIAGFAVGVVDREKIIDGGSIEKGDVIIGLPSSGVHSNGFSLIRKLFFHMKKVDIDRSYPELGDTLGNTLLTPTRIYTMSICNALEAGSRIKGLVHITGGGFYENIPRILPENCAAKIQKDSFEIPPIFNLIRKEGEIDEREMFTTFNMGIGMALITGKADAEKLIKSLEGEGENPVVMGEITDSGNEKVVLK
jgi:phosphoribosylformylglycinamidine cyclo-ligase